MHAATKTMTSPSNQRKQLARYLNRVIDNALDDPSPQHRQGVFHLRTALNRVHLTERVRRRASVLCHRDPLRCQQTSSARDALIFTIHAMEMPAGWFAGWCDGSSLGEENRPTAGIGCILTDGRGDVVARVSESVGQLDAFSAEIEALQVSLMRALACEVDQIKVHTDCNALSLLWHQHREDPRLMEIRTLAGEFRAVQLTAVPRQHNQPAHRLAIAAARNSLAIQDDARV